MRCASRTLCAILFSLIALGGAMQADEPNAETPQVNPLPLDATGDVYCGPRCTHFILNYYGIPADLYELITEIHDPGVMQGTSLEAIKGALERRGVHTSAIQIGSSSYLNWPHPVIVHLPGAQLGGHYVVQLSPSAGDDQHLVWLGLQGKTRVSVQRLAAARSGVVLLTSPEPIASIPSAISPRFPTVA